MGIPVLGSIVLDGSTTRDHRTAGQLQKQIQHARTHGTAEREHVAGATRGANVRPGGLSLLRQRDDELGGEQGVGLVS